jgi:GTP-binding protein
MIPLLAIVGRPNVGKSTLFNRLIRRRHAIVEDNPGVTRDRNYGSTVLEGRRYNLVDTGGFEPSAQGGIEALVREQTRIAIDEADLVLLLMDVRDGVLAADREVVDLLRRSGKPTLQLVNKVDGPKQEALVPEFYELGAARVLGISAEHGLGFDDLCDAILAAFPDAPLVDPEPGLDRDELLDALEGGIPERATEPSEPEPAGPTAIRLALVGRPNAGKSSLLNRLVGAERAIVSPVPGTTRDSIDAPIETAQGPFVIVDTAGIRRRRSIGTVMEKIAVLRALSAISDADVACLMLDAEQPVAEQDAKIASLALEAGRGLVLAVSKADRLPSGGRARRALLQAIEDSLGFVSYAPVVFISSLTGTGTASLLKTVRRVHAACGRRIGTGELNQFLEEIATAHVPPAFRGHPVRFYYMVQPQASPPTFLVTTNHADGVSLTYRRYVANRLRERYGFEGAPIRLFFRQRKRTPRE